MKKIVITGVSSFLGYHLADSLSKSFEIIGTATPRVNRSDIENLRLNTLKDKSIHLEYLDYLDTNNVSRFIHQFKPDAWIHHGAYVENYSDDSKFDLAKSLEINVVPLNNIFKILKENGCKHFILTGSSAEYSNSSQTHYESEILLPETKYGLSKAYQTMACGYLSKLYNVRTSVIRVFNAFGTYDSPTKIIPLIVNALKTNTPIDLSSCLQVRSFLSANQIATIYEAVLKKSDKLDSFNIFNAVASEGIVLRDLLRVVENYIKPKAEILKFGQRPLRIGEAPICIGSSQMLLEKLNLNFDIESVLEELRKII